MESLKSRPLPLPPLRLPEKVEKKEKPRAAFHSYAERIPVGLKKPRGTGYLRLGKVYGAKQ